MILLTYKKKKIKPYSKAETGGGALLFSPPFSRYRVTAGY